MVWIPQTEKSLLFLIHNKYKQNRHKFPKFARPLVNAVDSAFSCLEEFNIIPKEDNIDKIYKLDTL